MADSHSLVEPLLETEKQIAWVLAHPGMSDWLKNALRTGVDRDSEHLLNDLEILSLLLRAKAQAAIDERYVRSHERGQTSS